MQEGGTRLLRNCRDVLQIATGLADSLLKARKELLNFSTKHGDTDDFVFGLDSKVPNLDD